MNASIDLLPFMTPYERAEIARLVQDPDLLPPAAWLREHFPEYVTAPFAAHHLEFWEWVWGLRSGRPPRVQAFIGVWPRGGAKSTSAELAVVAVGARRRRHYVVYVRATQEMADRSVENVAVMLEQPTITRSYPALGTPQRGKFGSVRGWRRERLRTASGLTVDAFGLDAAFRGVKVDEQRPDLIVFDDVDEKFDSPHATAKKAETLTTSLLPAGSSDLAVLGIQNLMVPNGIFAQLVDGRAEFLGDRHVSGPHPALRNMTYEQQGGQYRITGGEPVWEGQNLEVCQRQVISWGLTAFLQEAQHEVDNQSGGMYDRLDFQHCSWDEVPPLVRKVVWVDPAVTETDASDSMGIQADGIAANGMIYRLWSWEAVTSPEDALRRALQKALELGAEAVGVETDQGGDTWQSVYRESARSLGLDLTHLPQFRSQKAGAGQGPKVERSGRMLSEYERGRFVHVVGTHKVLERGLRRFPRVKPLDLVDAAYWSWYDLTNRTGGSGAMF